MAKEIGKKTAKITEEAFKRARPERAQGKRPIDTLTTKEIKEIQKETADAIKAAEDVIAAMELAEEAEKAGLDMNMDATAVKNVFKEKVKDLKKVLKKFKKARPID